LKAYKMSVRVWGYARGRVTGKTVQVTKKITSPPKKKGKAGPNHFVGKKKAHTIRLNPISPILSKLRGPSRPWEGEETRSLKRRGYLLVRNERKMVGFTRGKNTGRELPICLGDL